MILAVPQKYRKIQSVKYAEHSRNGPSAPRAWQEKNLDRKIRNRQRQRRLDESQRWVELRQRHSNASGNLATDER